MVVVGGSIMLVEPVLSFVMSERLLSVVLEPLLGSPKTPVRRIVSRHLGKRLEETNLKQA